MTQINQILDFLKKNHGQITYLDVKRMGISSNVLSRMVARNQIVRLAPGVYIDPLEFGDELSALQYRLSKGIFFKSTALFLHGMVDRTPDTYEMNFPLSYVPAKNFDVPLKTYRQTEKLYNVGIEKITTPGGHPVRVYNVERTLCDIIRPYYQTDGETIKQAMVSYAQKSNKDIYKLAEYSKLFKVEKQMKTYMEVLL